jgi:hypothetical protein
VFSPGQTAVRDAVRVRLVRSFALAVLIGATVAAVILGAWYLTSQIIPRGAALAGLLVLIILRLGSGWRRSEGTFRMEYPSSQLPSRLPGTPTRDLEVRINNGTDDPLDKETDDAPAREGGSSTRQRQIPYGLQIANILVGLTVGVAGAIIAVVKL